jgi:hypothetical protein
VRDPAHLELAKPLFQKLYQIVGGCLSLQVGVCGYYNLLNCVFFYPLKEFVYVQVLRGDTFQGCNPATQHMINASVSLNPLYGVGVLGFFHHAYKLFAPFWVLTYPARVHI